MALSTLDVNFLREVVAEKSGNVISQRQVYMLEKQLLPLAETEGMEGVEQLVVELRKTNNQNLKTKIAEAVTVNETSFFRDIHPFETLYKVVIPNLIKKNQNQKQLRIWCGASSSGQEPYTIAMVIREHFPELVNWNVKLLATDLSEEMLDKTSKGEYTQIEVNRGLPVKKLVKFFDRKGTNWVAKPTLRDMIECRRLNLTQAWPYMGKFDLMFIRNVLIYFDPDVKKDILQRATKLLNPDSYLFIGTSEMVIGMGLPLEREKINETVCYRPSK